jgi:hypothetical protein
MLKKTLIAVFAAPFILIILAMTTVMVVLNWPTIIINPTTMEIAARHVVPLGIGVEWKRADTSSTSHGAFDETLKVEFDDLCVKVRPSVERACFSRVEASARYRFRAIIPEFLALGPIAVEGGDILIRSSEKEEKSEHEGILPIPDIRLPGFVAKAHIYPADVSIDSLVIEGEGPARIVAEAHIKPDGKGRIDAISTSTRIVLSKGQSLEADVEMTSASNFTKGDWALKAQSSANLGSAGRATLEAKAHCADGKLIEHDIKLAFSKDKMRADIGLAGTIAEERIDTAIKGALNGVSEFVPRISLANCSMELVSRSRRKNRGELSFVCSIDAGLKEFEIPEDVDPIYRQPKKLMADISAKADTFFFPDPDQETKARLDVRLRPQRSQLVRTTGDLRVEFDGIFSKPPKTWKITSNADIDFTIEKFAELVKVLSGSPWPVPAPFNVLDGSLQFSLEGSVSSATGNAVFPAKLRTKLESDKQRIFTDSDGKLEVGLHGAKVGKLSLELDVNLDDVQLQLPDLSLAGIPSLTPDGRIVLEPKEREEKPSEPAALDYEIKIATPKGRPARILSNITPTYVPIAIDVYLESEDMSGTVSVREFGVKLFTRTATVNNLDITLREPAEKSQVIGKLSVPFPDLTAIINLAGTVEEPSITLASKPPMSQGDIISYLLYGEPMDALDSDNASSASDMNAALANNAIALTSFFLLASTPIQSVGYNPDTGVFTAKIKLAKKTTIDVGGSKDAYEAGIRQRLGKGFSVTTGWEKTESDSQGAATAYIEWSKRY